MSMYRICKLFALHISILLLAEIDLVHSITWINEVNISVCNWSQLRANVIRDTIYLDGGDLWWQFGLSNGQCGTPLNDDGKTGYMYNLSLTQSFDQQTNLTGLLQAMPKNGGTSAANVNPNYEDGTMMANDYEFILYGGLSRFTDSYNPPPSQVVLGYEAFESSATIPEWSPEFVQKSTNNDVTRYITNGAGVSAPSENLSFYFSGMRGPDGGIIEAGDGSANTTATSLITVNMTTMGVENWENSTLPSYVLGRANAELVWLPVSESGVLIAIGGVINPEILTPDRKLTYNEALASNETSPTFMKQLSIYDIASQTWYLQNTTGDIPPQLALFCSVVAAAPDHSSFNIYIYGGYDGVNAESTPSDDVYILSVPSFIWIKAYSGQPSHGRSGHKCLKVYPDQMFVLGGIFQNDPAVCLDGGFVQVFNLNTLQFQDNYSPSNWSIYMVPSVVTDQIGGNTSGSATKLSPSSWNNDSLSSIFAKTYSNPITTYYPYTSTTQTSSATATTTATNATSIKSGTMVSWMKIVLGVSLSIGSVCIAGVVWLVARKLARRKLSKAVGKSDGSRNNDKRDAYWPSNDLEHYNKLHSTSTLFPAREGLGISQSKGPEHESTPATTDETRHTQADSYPIFELDSQTDKFVELPSEACEIRKKLNTLSRNLRDLRISPHGSSSHAGSDSIQSTPTEFIGKSSRGSVRTRVSRLTPPIHLPRSQRGSIPISTNANHEIDETSSNVKKIRSSSLF